MRSPARRRRSSEPARDRPGRARRGQLPRTRGDQPGARAADDIEIVAACADLRRAPGGRRRARAGRRAHGHPDAADQHGRGHPAGRASSGRRHPESASSSSASTPSRCMRRAARATAPTGRAYLLKERVQHRERAEPRAPRGRRAAARSSTRRSSRRCSRPSGRREDSPLDDLTPREQRDARARSPRARATRRSPTAS